MTPALGMYSMNMNGWNGLLQQGLGMLGGSSMGYGNFGSFGGCGIFTNCFGEINYDAMAGYGVTNAVLGVAMQAVAANKKEKASEVNYEEELAKISKEIQTKEIDKAEQTDIINSSQEKIDTATAAKATLTSELTGLKADLESKKQAYENAAKQNPVPSNLDALKTLYEKAEKAVEAKNQEITEQQKIIDDAKKAKSAAETKEAALQTEIDELKKKQAAYQEKLNENILDKADGNVLQRARKNCMEETYDEQNQASKADIRKAFNCFIKADNDTDKRKNAEKIQQMYKSNPKLADKFENAYKIVEQWLLDHPANN